MAGARPAKSMGMDCPEPSFTFRQKSRAGGPLSPARPRREEGIITLKIKTL